MARCVAPAITCGFDPEVMGRGARPSLRIAAIERTASFTSASGAAAGVKSRHMVPDLRVADGTDLSARTEPAALVAQIECGWAAERPESEPLRARGASRRLASTRNRGPSPVRRDTASRARSPVSAAAPHRMTRRPFSVLTVPSVHGMTRRPLTRQPSGLFELCGRQPTRNRSTYRAGQADVLRGT